MDKDDQIDACILRFVTERWQKVAVVAAKVMFVSDPDMSDVDDYAIAERVRALVDKGRIQIRGDLTNLRNSEIRTLAC